MIDKYPNFSRSKLLILRALSESPTPASDLINHALLEQSGLMSRNNAPPISESLLVTDKNSFYRALDNLHNKLGYVDKSKENGQVVYQIKKEFIELPRVVRKLDLKYILRYGRRTLNKDDVRILELCCGEPSLIAGVMGKLSLGKEITEKRMKKLIGLGLIEYVKEKRRTIWKTSNNGGLLLNSIGFKVDIWNRYDEDSQKASLSEPENVNP